MRSTQCPEETIAQIVSLRHVATALSDPLERARLARIVRQLRRSLGVGVPKRRAAASLGVSVQALERFVQSGAVPTTRKPGSSRELIDSEALLVLADEVGRLREAGQSRPLGVALRNLSEAGRMPRKLRPNQSARELRYEFLRTSPADRLRATAQLARTGSILTANARQRKARVAN